MQTSRRCERRASRGKGKYYPRLWEDILKTWKQRPEVFHYGCGQSTVAWAVYWVTGNQWPSHHIRRQLTYAINAGFVRRLRDGELMDEREPNSSCSRFILLKNGPLPKPQEPIVQNVSDIVESNGKTIRQNNTEKMHKFALGTLVEIPVTSENAFFEKYKGTRLFVVVHARDFDGTPIYSLSPNKELFEDIDKNNSQQMLWANMNLVDGLSEEDIKPVDLVKDEWPRVPPKGTYVIANHPITPLNPFLIFRVYEIKLDIGNVYVRGQYTCWFNAKLLRIPTDEEAVNPGNYHAEEL